MALEGQRIVYPDAPHTSEPSFTHARCLPQGTLSTGRYPPRIRRRLCRGYEGKMAVVPTLTLALERMRKSDQFLQLFAVPTRHDKHTARHQQPVLAV
jgi:hypothetical protein